MHCVKESKARCKYHQELITFISYFLCSFWEGCFKGFESLSFEREPSNWGGMGSVECLVGRCWEEVSCQVVVQTWMSLTQSIHSFWGATQLLSRVGFATGRPLSTVIICFVFLLSPPFHCNSLVELYWFSPPSFPLALLLLIFINKNFEPFCFFF